MITHALRGCGGHPNEAPPAPAAVPTGENAALPMREVQWALDASQTAYDAFGESLHLSGDGLTLAVSQHADNETTHGNVVHVFTRDDDHANWAWQNTVTPTVPSSSFGKAVGLSRDGSILAVGDDLSERLLGSTMVMGGGLSVYERQGQAWVLQQTLFARHPATAARLGAAVAISADERTIAAGAPFDSGSAAGVHGTAYTDLGGLSGAS